MADWSTPQTRNTNDIMTISILNTIQENFAWLKARPFDYLSIATTNTTSTSFVEMTGSSTSVTTTGGKVWIFFIGSIANSTGPANNRLDIAIDASRVGNATNGLVEKATINANDNDFIQMLWITSSPPALGSHAYSVYWMTSGGTLTGGGRLFVMEIL